jgi:hypothetical protein
MRLLVGLWFFVFLVKAEVIKIPPVKTSVELAGQSIEVSLSGVITGQGPYQLAVAADLGNLQENLTSILGAQLNQSERCGNRLTVDRAVLAPTLTPSADLTAYVHYERYACAKAFGKEIVKRLVGGNGVVEVNLAPSFEAGQIALVARVVQVDSDGSLGEILRSGTLGDSVREKIRTSIESALRKSADLKSALPEEIESVATIKTIQFADGGSGRLRLDINGEVRLTPEQLREAGKRLGAMQ